MSQEETNRRLHNRRNAAKEQDKKRKEAPSIVDATTMISVGTFAARRLPELKQLWYSNPAVKKEKGDVIQKMITNLSSQGRKCHSTRHLRRRTKSFMPRRRHRQANSVGEPSEKQCRRKRRKPVTMQNLNRGWWDEPTHKDAKWWLETHIWHAKRFYMCSLGNWRIPLMHTNRGTQSALRLVKFNPNHETTGPGCIILDHTYMHQPLIRIGNSGATGSTIHQQIQFILEILKSIGINLPSISSLILLGRQAKDVVVHEKDSYPRGCIGPGRLKFEWLDLSNICALLSVHPCIWMHVHDLIQELQKEKCASSKESNKVIDQQTTKKVELEAELIQHRTIHHSYEPTACLSLRGVNSTKVLINGIKPSTNDVSAKPLALQKLQNNISLSWDILQSLPQDAHCRIPHLSIIPVVVKLFHLENGDTLCKAQAEFGVKQTSETNKDEMLDSSADSDLAQMLRDQEANVSELNLCSNWLEQISSEVDEHIAQPPSSKNKNELDVICTLVSICPNSKQVAANAGVSGWDILCPATHAKAIHLALTLYGAAAIGLAEEAALMLEADPPLAHFPRDYPDSLQGQLYWSNQKSTDWSLIRSCLEQNSGGRCRLSVQKSVNSYEAQIEPKEDANSGVIQKQQHSESQETPQKSANSSYNISWTELPNSRSDEEEKDGEIVIVRGSVYGQPFRQALELDCKFSEGLTDVNTKLRHRRGKKKGLPCDLDNMKVQLQVKANLCDRLSQSLSLSAFIFCSITLCGKGTISAGDEVLLENTEEVFVIGYVTASFFSPTRGHMHGTAIVDAARLLGAAAMQMQELTKAITMFRRSEFSSMSFQVRCHCRNRSNSKVFRFLNLSLIL